MKHFALLVLSVAALSSSSAFAQSNQPADGSASGIPQVAQAAPLGRDQVYQQLVTAERDGSLARVNKTLYAHH
jgi:opacity protein-like surface antigen